MQQPLCKGRAGQGRAGQGRAGHTSSELIDGNGILDVLQGQRPIAPNHPWVNEAYSHTGLAYTRKTTFSFA